MFFSTLSENEMNVLGFYEVQYCIMVDLVFSVLCIKTSRYFVDIIQRILCLETSKIERNSRNIVDSLHAHARI